MFFLMLQKLLHKKWMVLCMLIGYMLLIAVALSHPLYRSSAFQRMLTDAFENHYQETGKYPAVFTASQTTLRGLSSSSVLDTEDAFFQALDTVNIPVAQSVTALWCSSNKAAPLEIRDDRDMKRIYLTAVTDFAEYVEIVQGQLPQSGRMQDGCYEVMLHESALVGLDALIGDVFTYEDLTDIDGSPLKIKITGVFRITDATEYYWEGCPSDLSGRAFLDMDTFREVMTEDGRDRENGLFANYTAFWDYRQITTAEVAGKLNLCRQVLNWDAFSGRASADSFREVVTSYSADAKRIELTLIILQVPVLLLLCAFLFMLSGQLLEMERNEISLLKSRGAKKGQILLLYFLQSLFLSLLSLLPGIPLGVGLCRLLGKSVAFLEFSSERYLELKFTPDAILFVGGAILLSTAMTTIPVIKYSGVSIVNLKQSKAQKRKSLWKKLYLDVICLAISLYGYYSFQRSSRTLVEDVLAGRGMDPLLYISFSLFVLGLSLFFCRIQPLFLRIFFRITSKRLKPAAYASLLSSIRTGYRQEFIIIFVMLTVAIGISNTSIARTIIANATANIEHLGGADIIIRENWGDREEEPVFSKYQTIPGVVVATKVLREDVTLPGEPIATDVMLWGIQTSGFYQVTDLQSGLLPYGYHDYLNVLAADSSGFLVSENFMKKLEYQLGDFIVVQDEDNNRISGYIRGFFNYWPGYLPTVYTLTEYGEVEFADQYLVVGNLNTIQNAVGVNPYEVWMAVDDGGVGFSEWAAEHPEIMFKSYENTLTLAKEKVETTLFQGTNGILSMSFLIILLLCCVGYLIYWIMSIRSRELLFGVLRAMGMRKGEVNRMLILEQFCSGFYAIAAGGLIGVLASRLFVPMIQNAYAAADQVLPLKLSLESVDVLQLFGVIGVVFCLCLVILGRIVSRMNISKALKLGED